MIKVKYQYFRAGHEVTLTPRSVQLCNVPKTCTLASDNSITDLLLLTRKDRSMTSHPVRCLRDQVEMAKLK